MDEPIRLRKEIIMFIIKPASQYDWVHALFILSHYHVSMTTYSDANSIDSVFMVVDGHEYDHPGHQRDSEEDLLCAEMAFQMNWHQSNKQMCESCLMYVETGIEVNCCGHLTFVKPIVPAF
jgi:hypothetical protein